MSGSLSEQRQIENEVAFRQANEVAQKELEELKQIAEEEGDRYWANNSDAPFEFYCECSDENCRQKVSLKPSMYKELHSNRKQFVLIPGHQAESIESKVLKTSDYTVVEKHKTPPATTFGLNATSIDNTSS